jgi:hypothetical protein
VAGQRIGYVRVSTLDQNERRQLDGKVLDRVFTDKASGRDITRPELAELGVNLCWWTPEVAGSLDSAGRCSCEHDTT